LALNILAGTKKYYRGKVEWIPKSSVQSGRGVIWLFAWSAGNVSAGSVPAL